MNINTNKKNNRAFTLIELVIVLAIVTILAGMILPAVGWVGGTSDGKRIGVITKFSYKGIFFKSYEGELNMGGVRNVPSENGSRLVLNVWPFSVSNPEVAKKIDDLLGKEVVIKYHQSPTIFRLIKSKSLW